MGDLVLRPMRARHRAPGRPPFLGTLAVLLLALAVFRWAGGVYVLPPGNGAWGETAIVWRADDQPFFDSPASSPDRDGPGSVIVRGLPYWGWAYRRSLPADSPERRARPITVGGPSTTAAAAAARAATAGAGAATRQPGPPAPPSSGPLKDERASLAAAPPSPEAPSRVAAPGPSPSAPSRFAPPGRNRASPAGSPSAPPRLAAPGESSPALAGAPSPSAPSRVAAPGPSPSAPPRFTPPGEHRASSTTARDQRLERIRRELERIRRETQPASSAGASPAASGG